MKEKYEYEGNEDPISKEKVTRKLFYSNDEKLKTAGEKRINLERSPDELLKRAKELSKTQDQEKLEYFYNNTCADIPAVKLYEGGNYGKSEIKQISANVFLYKKVSLNYDTDNKEYEILEGVEVIKNKIQEAIQEREEEIDELKSLNKEATAFISSLI